MLRGIASALSARAAFSFMPSNTKNGLFSFLSLKNQKVVNFTSIVPRATTVTCSQYFTEHAKRSLLDSPKITLEQIRTVTKFSLRKGARKSVKAVVRRFFRLHWGIWIRTMAGRHKKLWKKSGSQKNRLKNHVFCNSTQSLMLDKMVTRFWRKPKYYIDDPYMIYHTREGFHNTRKKPFRPEGVDYE